jgi:hypothetical protein
MDSVHMLNTATETKDISLVIETQKKSQKADINWF